MPFNYSIQSPPREAHRQHLIEFMRDDNPTNARMRFVIGGLLGLIKVDGITDLEPHLKVIMDISLIHITQAREGSSTTSTGLEL